MKLQVIFHLCLLAVFFTCSRSVLTGTSPDFTCVNMLPDYSANNATGGSPYLVSVAVPTDGYIPRATYSLTISKVDPDAGTPDFIAFFCQIQELGGIDALGQFSTVNTGTSSGKGKEITCPVDNPNTTVSNNAVANTNQNPVSNCTVHWTAPYPGLGEFQLNALCTIVQSRNVYWERVQSANRFAESTTTVNNNLGANDTTPTTSTKRSGATVTRIHVSLALCVVIVQGWFSYLLGW